MCYKMHPETTGQGSLAVGQETSFQVCGTCLKPLQIKKNNVFKRCYSLFSDYKVDYIVYSMDSLKQRSRTV